MADSVVLAMLLLDAQQRLTATHDSSVNSCPLGCSCCKQNCLSDGFCLSGRQKNLKEALSEIFSFALPRFFVQNFAELILARKRGVTVLYRNIV